MPTYEYICTACKQEWEADQSIKEDPLKVCPTCGASEAKRQISRNGNFVLKGSGWAGDSYSKPSYAPSAPSAAPAPSATHGGLSN